MKNILEVTGLSVTTAPDGRKLISVQAFMPGNVELDPDDMAVLTDLLNEAASRFDGGAAPTNDEPEPEEDKPAGRRRRSEPEPEPEAEPAQPRRRRAAKEEPEPEPEAEEKPRRRRAAKEEPEEKAEEPTEGRRRRRAAGPEEPKGPTADDVAKAASEAAQKLGPKITAEIIGEFSDSGKLDGIPADKRQAFIDEINFELSGD